MRSVYLLIAFVIVLFDQLTKYWINVGMIPGESIEITRFFNLVYVFNPGAAFSFLSDAPGWQRYFFTVVAIAVSIWIVYLLWKHPERVRFNFALTLVLGGAIGNVIDRIRLGAVIDFLDVHAYGYHWPAFNVADSAITCGAILLIWDSFFQRSRSQPIKDFP
jgi:signal peptidase II